MWLRALLISSHHYLCPLILLLYLSNFILAFDDYSTGLLDSNNRYITKPYRRLYPLDSDDNNYLYIDREREDGYQGREQQFYDRYTNSKLANVSRSLDQKCGQSTAPYISGGRDAELGDFPSYVALTINLRRHSNRAVTCGGTILTNKIVLTAAHCFRKEYSSVYVKPTIYNPHRHNDVSDMIRARRICQSSRYLDGDISHDIAIVKLEEPIHFNQHVHSACLAKDSIRNRAQAHAVGLGFNQLEFHSTPDVLQVLPVEKITCPFHARSDSNICFESNDPNYVGQVCQGDSGGPILASHQNRATLYGVVSRGPRLPCMEGVANHVVAANVVTLRREILSLIDKCNV